MFNKVSTKRKIVAGLGLLGSVGAVGLTQISSDMSKWPNFGANVGLSIGVSVFVWFLTEDLRERLFSKIADLQSAVGSELAQLKSDLETSKEWTEAQLNQLKKVLDIVTSNNSLLTAIDDEIFAILDGVLTALDVELEDKQHEQRKLPKIRPAAPARWQVPGTSQSVKDYLQDERVKTNETLSKARNVSRKLAENAIKQMLENILSRDGSNELEMNEELSKGLDRLQSLVNEIREAIDAINVNGSADESSVPDNSQ